VIRLTKNRLLSELELERNRRGNVVDCDTSCFGALVIVILRRNERDET
jgi:hypothetical protein